jgi:hypothetical protein
MENEILITREQAVALVPYPVTANAVWRWMRRGVRARNGEIIRLDHVRYGGKLFTSREALERFAVALKEADDRHFERVPFAPVSDVPARSRKARTREIAAAAKRVREAGI